jgi:hypothetical protein
LVGLVVVEVVWGCQVIGLSAVVGMDRFNRNGALAHSQKMTKNQRRRKIDNESTNPLAGKKGRK